MESCEAGVVCVEEFLKSLHKLQRSKEANEKHLQDLHESQLRELSEEKLRFLNSLMSSDELSESIFPNDSCDDKSTYDISKESELLYTPSDLSSVPSTYRETDECLNNSIKSNSNELIAKSLNDQAFPKANAEIIDEVPIVTKSNDFNALLENELCKESDDNMNEVAKTTIPKKYLKRGDGLRRFKMTRDDIGQINNKMPWLKKKPKSCMKTKSVMTIEPEISTKSSRKQLNFHADDPEVKNVNFDFPEQKKWTDTDENDECESDRISTSDTSISMSPSVTKKALNEELAEQKMFDLIEKKVENLSFTSPSSFFSKILGSFNCRVKKKPINIEKHLLELKPSPTKIVPHHCDDSNSSLVNQIRETSENIDEQNKSDSKSITNEEVDDCSDSDDTTVSSISEETCRIADNAISTSTPNQNYASSFERKVQVVNTKNINDGKKNIVITLVNNDTTCTESGSESHTLTEICTDEEGESVDNNEVLKIINEFELKIKELERNVDILRKDNVLLKEELELKKKAFLEEQANFEAKLNEEKVIAEYYLAEEREKLQKNMSLYDRHIKEMKAQLSRKEKEKQNNFNKDFEELKEKLEAKNAKCSLLHAKFRNQIKTLESENQALKEECEKLKKEKRKLKDANARTQKLSNIKLLADINKSLSSKSIETNEENFEYHKGISTESVNSLGTKQSESVSQNKPKPRARTKSVPNINITSRYAKFFSEKDSKNDLINGYGLQSDEESESDDIQINREKSVMFSQIENPQNRMSDEYLRPDLSKNVKSRCTDDDIHKKSYSRSLVDDEPHANIDVPTPRTSLTETLNLSIGKYKENSNFDKTVKSDGTTEIKFSNGNCKILSADGSHSKFFFYNGDIKEVFYKDGVIKYYYKDPDIHQTTYKDGSEVLLFPDGYIEKRYPDGTVQSHLPDGTVKWIKPGNVEECRFPDGTLVSVNNNGEQTIRFPNGQVEIHTSEFMKREFPDGTVKIVYADGSTETIFASGRIRTKDKAGNLIIDTANRKSDKI